MQTKEDHIRTLFLEFKRLRGADFESIDFQAFEFYYYCIERYITLKGMPRQQVESFFEHYGADHFLIDNYDLLHTQGLDLVMEDVDMFIDARK